MEDADAYISVGYVKMQGTRILFPLQWVVFYGSHFVDSGITSQQYFHASRGVNITGSCMGL